MKSRTAIKRRKYSWVIALAGTVLAVVCLFYGLRPSDERSRSAKKRQGISLFERAALRANVKLAWARLIAAQARYEQSTKRCVVKGHVQDRAGFPHPGAQISIQPISDTDAEYESGAIADANGDFSWRFTSLRYASTEFLVRATAGELAGEVRLYFRSEVCYSDDALEAVVLEPQIRISGVVTKQGIGIGDVKVQARRSAAATERSGISEATGRTLADGTFALSVIGDGLYEISVAGAYNVHSEYVQILNGQSSAPLHFSLPPTESFVLSAFDENGYPIEGAQVETWNGDPSITDSFGQVLLQRPLALSGGDDPYVKSRCESTRITKAGYQAATVDCSQAAARALLRRAAQVSGRVEAPRDGAMWISCHSKVDLYLGSVFVRGAGEFSIQAEQICQQTAYSFSGYIRVFMPGLGESAPVPLAFEPGQQVDVGRIQISRTRDEDDALAVNVPAVASPSPDEGGGATVEDSQVQKSLPISVEILKEDGPYVVTGLWRAKRYPKGLLPGDEIISLDGKPVGDTNSFYGKSGAPAKLGIRRPATGEFLTVVTSYSSDIEYEDCH